MSEFPAMPFWFDAYYGDTSHLTYEEHGIYLKVLRLLWHAPGRRIPNDEQWIERRFGAYTNKAMSLIREFCECDGNYFSQKRVTREYNFLIAKRNKRSVAAKLRWEKEKASYNADAPTPTPTPTQVSKKEGSKKDTGKKLLPDTWTPTEGHYELAASKGLSKEEVKDASDEMRSWSLGNGERRTNWDWVFNNWLRRNAQRRNGNGQGRPRPLQDDRLSVTKAADKLIEAAKRGEFKFGPRPTGRPDEGEADLRLLPPGRGSRS